MLTRRSFVSMLAAAGAVQVMPRGIAAQEATPAAPPTPVLPVTVPSAHGKDVTVTDVSRIIPLSGEQAETVFALGLGANVVGTDVSATYPEAVRDLPKIGYRLQLSAEAVLSLNPTVVIGDTQVGPPEVITQIESAGVPVVIIEAEPTLDAAAAKIRSVAAALGVAEAGEALATTTQQEVDAAVALAQTATSQPRVLFLLVRGEGVQLIGGVGTEADAMIVGAGAINAAADAGVNGYGPITPEALATAHPDIYLLQTVALESVGGIDGLLEIPGVAQTPAGQNRAVVDQDDLLLLGLTPRTGQALTELILAFHPELHMPDGDGAATPVAGA